MKTNQFNDRFTKLLVFHLRKVHFQVPVVNYEYLSEEIGLGSKLHPVKYQKGF